MACILVSTYDSARDFIGLQEPETLSDAVAVVREIRDLGYADKTTVTVNGKCRWPARSFLRHFDKSGD